MAKRVTLDLYLCNIHAQEYMKQFNITYQKAVPQSIADCWHFWNCENLPDPLPEALSMSEHDPMRSIGFGLSKEDAISIKEYADKLEK